MKFHRLIRTQRLPIPPDVCWAFFANPSNWEALNPPWLHVSDESPEHPRQIYPGMLRIARWKPWGWLGYQVVSEVTHINPQQTLIEQHRMGPFALWHHTITLKSVDGGVEVIDTLQYAFRPGGVGEFIHDFFIRNQLENLFDYRERVLDDFFGEV